MRASEQEIAGICWRTADAKDREMMGEIMHACTRDAARVIATGKCCGEVRREMTEVQKRKHRRPGKCWRRLVFIVLMGNQARPISVASF